MAELLAQIIAVFGTPLGRGVLALASLAMIALVIIAFWGPVRMPRRDRVSGEELQTAPPPLVAPKLVTRGGKGGFGDERPALVRNALLAVIAVSFAVIVGFTMRVVGVQGGDPPVDAAAASGLTQTTRAVGQEPRSVPVGARGEGDLPHRHVVPTCQPGGSLSDRFVEVCEAGALVRFDLLRFTHGGRDVLKPSWDEAAPTVVNAESHAAPISLAGDLDLAAPETVRPVRYDGYLVIGVGGEGEAEAGAERAESLRGFAIRELSGGDRAECLGRERIYTVAATFDGSSIAAVEEERARVAAMRKAAARGGAHERAALEAAEEALAKTELLLTERPAPIVIGLVADPYTSDADADMRRAAERFLKAYGPALQLADVGEVAAMDACARGGAGR